MDSESVIMYNEVLWCYLGTHFVLSLGLFSMIIFRFSLFLFYLTKLKVQKIYPSDNYIWNCCFGRDFEPHSQDKICQTETKSYHYQKELILYSVQCL